jgi:hypothetical protein
VMSKQHARLLTGSSWCKSTLGSHFPTKERVRSVEDAVLKTVAPHKVSGVRVPGAPPIFQIIHHAPLVYQLT